MFLPKNSKRRATGGTRVTYTNRPLPPPPPPQPGRKSKRIEEFLEQAKFDLEMDSLYMNKSESELSFQKGIIRGLEISLRILRD